ARARALDIGARGAPAHAAMDIALGDMHALLAEGVVVLRPAIARVHAGLQKGLVELAFGWAGLDPHRPAAAAIGIWPLVEALRPLEIGQAMGIGPAGQPLSRPIVVVPRIAADPVHAVNGGGAAEDPAPRLIDSAPVEIWVGLAFIIPVEA